MNRPVGKQQIIADIQRVARKLRKNPGDVFSRSEYLNGESRFSYDQIYSDGDGWTPLCEAAGFKTKAKAPVSDQEYFQRLSKAVQTLGRFPKTYERTRYGLTFKKSRWSKLSLFLDDAVKLGVVPDLRAKRLDEPSPGDIVASPVAPASRPIRRHKKSQTTPPIPAQTRRKKWERTAVQGFPYAPHDELGVVALFAILCANRTFGWEILEFNGGKGIDATCWDREKGQEIRVELKHILSRAGWNHKMDEIDYVVCWENRWKDFPKPVIELRERIS